MSLTAQEQETIDDYNEMFATKGWSRFLGSVIDEQEQLKERALTAVSTELALGEIRGANLVISTILSLEETMDAMQKDSDDEDEAEDEVE